MMGLQHAVEALPPELGILIQLAVDDNRPTLILESTPPRIVFRNDAFGYALAERPDDLTSSAVDEWLSIELSDPSPGQATQTTNFAGRAWIKKKLGTCYTIIYCHHEFVRAPEHVQSDNVQRLDGLVYDWIRYPNLVPVNDWIRYLQTYPWENTSIGPMAQWPALLCDNVLTFMHCQNPCVVLWGEDLIQLYNEPAANILGAHHPATLGNKTAPVWGQSHSDRTADMIRASHEDGKSVLYQGSKYILDRDGIPEESYFDVFLLPFTGPDGRWVSSVACFTEVTSSVIQAERNEVSTKVFASAANASTLSELWSAFLSLIDQDSNDVMYALLYTVDDQHPESSPSHYRLHGSAGITDPAAFSTITRDFTELLQRAQAGEEVMFLEDETLLPELKINVADHSIVKSAFVVPISDLKGIPLSFIILGMSSLRLVDGKMKQFIYSLGEVLFKAIVILQSSPDQRKLLQTDDSISYRLQLERLSRQSRTAMLNAEKEQQKFGAMAEKAPIGIFLYEPDGTPLFTNDQYHALLGKPREAFYGKSRTGTAWIDCILEEDRDYVMEAWNRAFESPNVINLEFRVEQNAAARSSPSRARWLASIVLPLRDANGTLKNFQGYLMDISDRKLSEYLTTNRMNDAVESKRASENFIDMVCHEIRNPLSSILQLAETILATLPDTLPLDVCETLADVAQTITICAMHQKTIIDEVLTFSKLDSNLLVLAPERVEPRIIVEKAMKMFEAELVHAGIQSCIEQIPNDCAVGEIMCDPGRLLQIIINFLTNAIKFTKDSTQRQIKVAYGSLFEAPREEDCAITFVKPRKKEYDDMPVPMSPDPHLDNEEEELYLYISVEDSGCGLTAEESQILFKRFAQASPRTYRQYGGSGLGLFICRELVELQDGRIGMRGEAGKGSKFAFYIKAKRAFRTSRSQSVASVESAVGVKDMPQDMTNAFDAIKLVDIRDVVARAKTKVKDMNVLVVEDNEINRKVMAKQLRKLGCKVHVAEHGLEALNFLSTTKFSSSTEGSTPLSLILLDIEMPVMDGLSCIRRIRQLEEGGEISEHIPTIAITANARNEQIATAIEAGMDEVVTKPFKISDLVPRMEALVDKWSGVG